MWEDPGQTGKGHGHRSLDRGNITSYTWGWFSVWLTGSRLQSIAVSILCMRQRCAVMEPVVSSTPHSGHMIRLRSIPWYESFAPMHFSAMASYKICARNVPGWHIIVCDLATLAARPYILKRPTRTFIAC